MDIEIWTIATFTFNNNKKENAFLAMLNSQAEMSLLVVLGDGLEPSPAFTLVPQLAPKLLKISICC